MVVCLTHMFLPKHETNYVLDCMQRFTMDSEYEGHNLADFEVVRSTQFMDEYTRRVSIQCAFHLGMDMCYSKPAGDTKGSPNVIFISGLSNNARF